MSVGMFFLFLAGSSASFAQDTRNAELASSNAELNTTYGKLMKRLDAGDKVVLRNAQRAWIAFRDADCASTYAFPDRRECLMTRTDERVEQLKAALGN